MRKNFKIILGVVCGIAFSAIGAMGLQNSKTVQAAEIIINENNFPDKIFKSYVETNIDKNKDKILSDAEIKSVNFIDLEGDSEPEQFISSMKGIEYFSSLYKLNCQERGLTKLDISQNKMLEELDCGSNKLDKLDISQNKLLKRLECNNNKLTKLDISNNTLLEYLECSINQITELDASKNPSLSYLYCVSSIRGAYLTQIQLNKKCYNKLFIGYGCLDEFSNEQTDSNYNNIEYDFDVIPISNISNSDYDSKYYPDGVGLFGYLNVDDITKPGICQMIIYKFNAEDSENRKEYKKYNFTITYIDPNMINTTPSGDFTAPSCTRLFSDYNYTSLVSGSPIIIYGNGGTFKTGTTKTTNKQFTAYTDILASYKYTLNNKGIVKPAAGKVIVGITKSNTKPVVTKNKIVDADAAKIAKAKIKNGQITVTASGKEKGLVYLWIIDTGDKGVSECCPVNVLLAPRKLEVQDTSGSKLNNPKIENGKTLDVCVTGFVSSTKTDDCTYTATVAPNSQGYISIVPNGNSGNKFTITATGLKNNKNTKTTVIFQCNENGKKLKFALTVTP